MQEELMSFSINQVVVLKLMCVNDNLFYLYERNVGNTAFISVKSFIDQFEAFDGFFENLNRFKTVIMNVREENL